MLFFTMHGVVPQMLSILTSQISLKRSDLVVTLTLILKYLTH